MARRTTGVSGHVKGRALPLTAADLLERALCLLPSRSLGRRNVWLPSCCREEVPSPNLPLGVLHPDFFSSPDMSPPWDARRVCPVKSAVSKCDVQGRVPMPRCTGTVSRRPRLWCPQCYYRISTVLFCQRTAETGPLQGLPLHSTSQRGSPLLGFGPLSGRCSVVRGA